MVEKSTGQTMLIFLTRLFGLHVHLTSKRSMVRSWEGTQIPLGLRQESHLPIQNMQSYLMW